jgi:3-oxoacyl-[acyl-carrier protein] reductase
MNLNLEGKVALVTGSSRGIGKSIATTLYEEGCKVVLNGRHKDILKITAKPLGGNYFVADVTNPKECGDLVDYIIKKYGKLDILICNVGSGKSVPHGMETNLEWKKMLDLNFFSATNIIYAAMDSLKKTRGVIVCISSIAGMENTDAPIAYSIAKTALNSYVKRISKSLAKNSIRINSVSPGNIFFKGSVWEKKIKDDKSKVNKMLRSEVALGRFGTPEEVSNLVIFLASSKSSFVTGSNFVIDGGQLKSG